MRLNNIVKRPIVTEKSVSAVSEHNRYTFEVDKKASKGAVANAVNKMFGVEVTDVRTMVMPGKKRRVKGTPTLTKTPSSKKAVVTLKDGQKIDLFTSLMGEKKA